MSGARCPICNGSGKIEHPKHTDERETKKIMAKALAAHGYSYRQIANLVGWRSPRSVQLALKDGSKSC